MAEVEEKLMALINSAKKEEAPAEPIDTVPAEEEKATEEVPVPAEQNNDDDFIIGDEDVVEAEEQIVKISSELGLTAKTSQQLKKELEAIKEEAQQFKALAETKFANDEVARLDQYVREGGDLGKFLKIEDEYTSLATEKAQIESLSDVDAWEVRLRLSLAESYGEDEIDEQIEVLSETTDDAKKVRIGKEFKKGQISALESKLSLVQSKKEAEIAEAKKRGEHFSNTIKAEIDKTDKVGQVRLNIEQRQALKNENPKEFIKTFFPVDKEGNPVASEWAKSMFLLKFGMDSIKKAYEKGLSKSKKENFEALANVDGTNYNRINGSPSDEGTKKKQELARAAFK